MLREEHSHWALAPVWVILSQSLFNSLAHPPLRRAHRHFAFTLIGDAFAVRERLGVPTEVPGFRGLVCLTMSPSPTPEGPPAVHPVSCWPAVLAFAVLQPAQHPRSPSIRFRRDSPSRLNQFALAATWWFVRLPGGSDLSRIAGPPETFTFGLPTFWFPASSPNIATVPTGQFTPMGLPFPGHPLDKQLASLHCKT